MKQKNYIGIIEASKYCGVSRPTFRKWVAEGIVDAYITPGGTAKIPIDGLLKMMKSQGIPIPDDLTDKNSHRVLIVDDDPKIRDILSKSLSLVADFDITEAGNGIDACIKIGNIRPDLIIMDLRMPKMDGQELLKEIQKSDIASKVKIIVISGYPEDLDEEYLKASGVSAFFEKPVEISDFNGVVVKLLDLPPKKFSKAARS